jgi:hypothetical protein
MFLTNSILAKTDKILQDYNKFEESYFNESYEQKRFKAGKCKKFYTLTPNNLLSHG